MTGRSRTHASVDRTINLHDTHYGGEPLRFTLGLQIQINKIDKDQLLELLQLLLS